jgi:tetratricopeptide (TPR) repeat protein
LARLLTAGGFCAAKQICAAKPKLDYYPYKMAGRTITGGLAANRDRCSDSSWLPRCFPAYAAGLLLLALSPALQAQKSSPHQSAPVTSSGNNPTFGPGTLPPGQGVDPFEDLYASPTIIPILPASDHLMDSEGCNSWTESGVRSPTVSIARLAVPGKATSEYQRGCGAYKDKRLDQAERYLRKAIDIYPSYPAAWVVLGQVLDAQHKREEAKQACSEAIKIDSTYVAPYLCLAEFSATEDDWKQVSSLSERALALDPANNPYSLYYTADAAFHLNDLAAAERNALAAVALDPWHHIPRLHLLLAQIYAAKGDPDAEAAQLRDYLKVAPNSGDAAGARDTLAQLQLRPAK